jgi:hypothetical protein
MKLSERVFLMVRHEMFDSLLAEYLARHSGSMPSTVTAMDLLQYSAEAIKYSAAVELRWMCSECGRIVETHETVTHACPTERLN